MNVDLESGPSPPSHAPLSPVVCQTTVDDPADEERINCVLTALSRNASGTTADKDFNIARMVHIAQPARFFRPSLGLEIVVCVIAHANTTIS